MSRRAALPPADAAAPGLPSGGAARRGRVAIRPTRDAADIAAWLTLAGKVRAAHAADGTGDGLPYDEDMLRRSFERGLAKDNCCLLQAELGGALVGGLAGAAGPHFHSLAIGARVIAWYVLPEHRRRPMVAVELLGAFGRWAKARGAVRLYVGVTSGYETARADRLLKRLGFRFRGGNYMASL